MHAAASGQGPGSYIRVRAQRHAEAERDNGRADNILSQAKATTAEHTQPPHARR
eukprot:SAG22_NODE_16908_length_315_cov_0.694444_1_plen_53_part_10